MRDRVIDWMIRRNVTPLLAVLGYLLLLGLIFWLVATYNALYPL